MVCECVWTVCGSEWWVRERCVSAFGPCVGLSGGHVSAVRVLCECVSGVCACGV